MENTTTTNTETNTTSSNTIGNGNKQLETGWQLVPRKILGGLIAMLLVAQAAKELKDMPLNQFAMVIVCMSLLGFAAILTHYFLERGQKKNRDSGLVARDSGNLVSGEYNPDIPDKKVARLPCVADRSTGGSSLVAHGENAMPPAEPPEPK